MVSSVITDLSSPSPARRARAVDPSTPIRPRPRLVAITRDSDELTDPEDYRTPEAGQRVRAAVGVVNGSPGQSARRRRFREFDDIEDDETDAATRAGGTETAHDFCEQILDLVHVEYERLEVESNRLFEANIVLENKLQDIRVNLNTRHDQFYNKNNQVRLMKADRVQRKASLNDSWYLHRRRELASIFDDIRDYTKILRQQSTAMSRLQVQIRKCDDDIEWMKGVRLVTEIAQLDDELLEEWVRDTFREVSDWAREERSRILVPDTQ